MKLCRWSNFSSTRSAELQDRQEGRGSARRECEAVRFPRKIKVLRRANGIHLTGETGKRRAQVFYLK